MGNSGGFERAMQAFYTAYYYAVPDGGSKNIIAMGQEFIDHL